MIGRKSCLTGNVLSIGLAIFLLFFPVLAQEEDPNPDSPTPDFIVAGYNLRLTEFQAALGTGQLKRWPDLMAARRRAAQRYDDLLASTSVRLPRALEPASHTYQSYIVLLPERAASRRGAIIAELRERGIEVTIGTHHIPLTRYYRERYGYRVGQFPVTDEVAARALALPLHSKLQVDQQERVVHELMRLL